MDEFTRKRWREQTDPTKHKPETALEAIKADIDAGTRKPKHIIVIYVDEDDTLGFYQAGSLDGWAQTGAALVAANWISKAD